MQLHNLLVEHRKQVRLVCNAEQLIRSLGLAAQMPFLSPAKHDDLIEADGLWMFESKDRKPIKLAGQETCARSDCGSRNHEHQHAFAGHPAIAVFQKYQLHPFVTVGAKLSVIWRVQIQERTIVR